MNLLAFDQWCKLKKAQIYTFLVREGFGSASDHVLISPPFRADNPSGVHLGSYCRVNEGCWIDTIQTYASVDCNGRLDIGDHVYIGYRTHIIAAEHIKIGNNVVIADRVFISDSLHGYEDPEKPVISQPLMLPGPVVIEDQVWLGEGVCVLPNVTIGRHSVIGSNSVVTKDIPAHCVAAGMPARVIKRYNVETQQWEKV